MPSERERALVTEMPAGVANIAMPSPLSDLVKNQATTSSSGPTMRRLAGVDASPTSASKLDLIWRNRQTGQTVAWAMGGTQPLATNNLLSLPDWRISRVLDLDGDGEQDYIWENKATGQLAAWTMSRNGLVSQKMLLELPAWSIVATGDFNGDGAADLIFQNASTGQTVMWLMNGVNVTSSVVLLTHENWRVVAAADLDGDGKTDLIWQHNTTGQVVGWLMNGAVAKSSATLLNVPGWSVTFTGDLDGDGKADLIWLNQTTGQTVAWLMNGLTTASSASLFTHPTWRVVGVADFTGDGRQDLVWKDSATGATAIWVMNGLSVGSNDVVLRLSDWVVVSTADLDGDTRADLVWRNTKTDQTVAWLMNGTQVRQQVELLNLPGWEMSATRQRSILASHGWTKGQMLEADDNAVGTSAYGIDDQGRVMAVFLKSNGTRNVLYATRATPNAAGVDPSWSAPVAIDVQNGSSVNSLSLNDTDLGIAVAPNGNAVAQWFAKGNCTANTYKTAGTCNYLVVARYLAATGVWESPIIVTDNPSTKADLNINSAGDIAFAVNGWTRSANGYADAATIWWRPAAAAGFQSRVFKEVAINNFQLGMDAAGNMLVAAEANQNSTTDLVAYRGTQAGGFGSQLALESRGAAAQLRTIAVGLGGQQMVIWSQNNGTALTLFAATATSASAAFDLTDIGANGALNTLSYGGAFMSDDGIGRVYYIDALYAPQRLIWSNGVWASTWLAMPRTGFSSAYLYGGNRNGDLLAVNPLSNGGDWGAYDGASNRWIQNPAAGAKVLGVGKSAGYLSPVLSINGHGALLMRNQFDTLPSPAAPAGDARTVTSLWGTYLK